MDSTLTLIITKKIRVHFEGVPTSDRAGCQ